jgi:pseudaminic acid synthase
LGEIRDADEAVGANGGVFLHCTSEYPALPERAGLIGMLDLRATMPHRNVGVSDHTTGPIVPIAATAMGACVIEKHIRLNGDRSTEDAAFSLDEREFKEMVDQVRLTHEALKVREEAGNPSRQLRRSLYAVEDIEEGETMTEENIRSIRPGYGVPPKNLPKLLGKKSKQKYKKGDRII